MPAHGVASGGNQRSGLFHSFPLKVIEFDKDDTTEVRSDFSFDATCDICERSQLFFPACPKRQVGSAVR